LSRSSDKLAIGGTRFSNLFSDDSANFPNAARKDAAA
jgi:hypothetical protein